MIRAIVVDKLPSQPRINLIWPRCQRPMIEVLNHRGRRSQELRRGRQPKRAGERRQASPRQYTGFPNPAMAFLAHPFPGSVSYFKSLDHKPRSAPRNGLSPYP